MIIRCALLVVTTDADPVDEEAVAGLRHILGRRLPGLFVVEERQYASDRHLLAEVLRGWCDEGEMDLIFTVGGTFPAPGHSGDQIAPEATRDILEREMPSLPEAMRADAGEEEIEALLDRGVAGIRTRTLIVNLPGQVHLTGLFAEAIVDLIPLILARLRSSEQPQQPDEPAVRSQSPLKSSASGLDPEEFAAFLAARRQKEKPE